MSNINLFEKNIFDENIYTFKKDKPSGLTVDYLGIGDKLGHANKKYVFSRDIGNVVIIDANDAFDFAKKFGEPLIIWYQKVYPSWFKLHGNLHRTKRF